MSNDPYRQMGQPQHMPAPARPSMMGARRAAHPAAGRVPGNDAMPGIPRAPTPAPGNTGIVPPGFPGGDNPGPLPPGHNRRQPPQVDVQRPLAGGPNAGTPRGLPQPTGRPAAMPSFPGMFGRR